MKLLKSNLDILINAYTGPVCKSIRLLKIEATETKRILRYKEKSAAIFKLNTNYKCEIADLKNKYLDLQKAIKILEANNK